MPIFRKTCPTTAKLILSRIKPIGLVTETSFGLSKVRYRQTDVLLKSKYRKLKGRRAGEKFQGKNYIESGKWKAGSRK